MNGFEKHGIKHSSASAINCYAAAPCFWVAKYLHGYKGTFGAAPFSGILVESAVVNVIARGWSAADAIEDANKSFNKKFSIGATEKDYKRRDAMAGMIEQSLEALKPYGEPDLPKEGQVKIELQCNGDGWELPVIGYLDLPFDKHGVDIDLKSTMRIPSFMSLAHKRQRAIYKAARGNRAQKFLYVSPKKSALLEADDDAEILAGIKELLNRQERFLSLGDADMLRSVVPVNEDSFYWTGEEDERKKLYGI